MFKDSRSEHMMKNRYNSLKLRKKNRYMKILQNKAQQRLTDDA